MNQNLLTATFLAFCLYSFNGGSRMTLVLHLLQQDFYYYDNIYSNCVVLSVHI